VSIFEVPTLRVLPCSEAPSLVEETADSAIVQAIRRGDANAPTALFDRHAARIERLLYRLLGPQAELPDAINETFCRALEHLDDGVLALADAARLSRHKDFAQRALARLRARFPDTREALMAAFYLGVMAFEEGDFTHAATASLASHGNTLLVGAPSDGEAAAVAGTGAVYIFRK
jgi:hypothetical protein